jgi:hypothetical protein
VKKSLSFAAAFIIAQAGLAVGITSAATVAGAVTPAVKAAASQMSLVGVVADKKEKKDKSANPIGSAVKDVTGKLVDKLVPGDKKGGKKDKDKK